METTSRPQSADIAALPRSETAPRRTVFVQDLVLDAEIGAYDHEYGVTQRVRINIEIDVLEPTAPADDSLEGVLCYDKLTRGVKNILTEGHIKLVETLAERIASLALSHPLALSVSVRIEKPNAIEEAAAVGVKIHRRKS